MSVVFNTLTWAAVSAATWDVFKDWISVVERPAMAVVESPAI
jgi:hypothetical protein